MGGYEQLALTNHHSCLARVQACTRIFGETRLKDESIKATNVVLSFI